MDTWFKDHKTMVLLGVKDEDELLYESNNLSLKDIPHRIFHEPDINQHTAVAIHPNVSGELFNHLKLL